MIVGGIIVLGSAFWIGKKVIGKVVSNNESGKGFDEGSTAAIAKKLKMGFENRVARTTFKVNRNIIYSKINS